MDSGVDIRSAAVCGAPRMLQFLRLLLRRKKHNRRVVTLFLSHGDGNDESDAFVKFRESNRPQSGVFPLLLNPLISISLYLPL